ncbi:MAG: hypothetical protein RLZZ536_2922, partial [Planctomycetota bacterium]
MEIIRGIVAIVFFGVVGRPDWGSFSCYNFIRIVAGLSHGLVRKKAKVQFFAPSVYTNGEQTAVVFLNETWQKSARYYPSLSSGMPDRLSLISGHGFASEDA